MGPETSIARGRAIHFGSARTLWREIRPRVHEVCLAGVKRDWDYGLAWYAGFRLPTCDLEPKPLQVAPALPGGAILQPRP